MKFMMRSFWLTFALLALSGCHKKLPDSTLPASVKRGDYYYTQVTMQYEKGRFRTTNYRRGVLLPVNTQVELIEITNKDIQLEILPERRKLTIENVAKHTGDNTTQAFAKLFNKRMLDLSQFNKLEREHIQLGRVAKKMRKDAVIAAIGYPPVTETSSTQMNRWVYWNSRYDRFVVHFNDHGKVDRIEQ